MDKPEVSEFLSNFVSLDKKQKKCTQALKLWQKGGTIVFGLIYYEKEDGETVFKFRLPEEIDMEPLIEVLDEIECAMAEMYSKSKRNEEEDASEGSLNSSVEQVTMF